MACCEYQLVSQQDGHENATCFFLNVVLVAALVSFSFGWLLLVGCLSIFLFTVGCRLLPTSLLLAVICSVCYVIV